MGNTRYFFALPTLLLLAVTSFPLSALSAPLGEVLERNFKLISRSSVKSIGPVIEEIKHSGHPASAEFLENWQSKSLWYRKSDKQLVYLKKLQSGSYELIDPVSGENLGTAEKKEIKQIRPNSGVRKLIGTALIESQLLDADPKKRIASLNAIYAAPEPGHLQAIRNALDKEADQNVLIRMARLERLLTVRFESETSFRVMAIKSLKNNLDLESRAVLNQLLQTRTEVSEQGPATGTYARIIIPDETVKNSDGTGHAWGFWDWVWNRAAELTEVAAYDLLVSKQLAPPLVSSKAVAETLAKASDGQSVAGVPIEQLSNPKKRTEAYELLVRAGAAQPAPAPAEISAALANHIFFAQYIEPDSAITDAARETLVSIHQTVAFYQLIDLVMDGLSLASIFFLAAIGLAITFGVMRVINMAHGEFIMMGAYTGYLVQQIISNHTLSILVAIPLAFCVTFMAGIVMERTVIRHLYQRPLETLLATFGISIALQQLAKNIFGTQARPLTAPDWLEGSLVINEVVSISWIRVAIFVLSIVFFTMLLFILNKTRLGLETRAVTQNPRMAASMGINPDHINMLTFGLGSGIAGIAGVAIGLYAKVTSSLGSDYIVQSFMTVVVGGVGNIWGTITGAALIGFLQKSIEFFNPSNTLAAQTYMIIFIIVFIQFRPRGIVALKGRAAEA